MKLTAPTIVKALLAKYGLRPSKGLGQNFLINEHYLKQIVAAAELVGDELVVEIGSGLGVLTRELAQVAKKVITIEKDRRLLPVLNEVLGDMARVELVLEDALQVDYQQLVGNNLPAKVVANLPYYITTPLITRLLEQEIAWSGLVFLVQSEVADRMMAGPGSKEYGLLSVMVQWEYDVKRVARVPASAFYPAPKVASTVVKLIPWARSKPLPVNKEWLGQVLRSALGQRRKTLLNALTSNLAVTREQVQVALSHLGLEAGVRGEDLTPEQFIQLAAQLV
ncbi:MAG TPA: ribosomal RNA small subunit methyltransferase A [Firmicutes bacterium]|nr:ribosomal RNA small subunit methyltransferase A [Bacillota bacterium]